MGSVWKRARRRVRIIGRFEWNAYWRRRPIRPRTVLYESFSGNGMLCNPEAIFRELLRAPDMADLEHVWVLSDRRRYRRTVAEFRGVPNVRFVRYDSPAYHRALATCRYLVNNSTFPPQFAKRDGQTYLNTWHGTPLKKMGYDIPGGGPDTRNIIRNFLHADYLVSSSEFMTRQMYETGYKLRGIYRGRIIQEGSPRVDARQLRSGDARALLAGRGVAVDHRKVILYAPTWRGDSFHTPDNDVRELADRVAELNRRIDTGTWRVLLKVHQQVYPLAADEPALRDVLVPNDVPSNVALGAADVLVTDYSSIFYDFLATGRPVLFFTPDLDAYTGARGLYLPPDRLPGPVTASLDVLAGHIGHLGTGDASDVAVTFADRYRRAAGEHCPLDDGTAAARVVDVVFRGRTGGYDIRDDFRDGRRSILVYLGGLRPNGINSSALNLLNSIDHDRFDVSALYSYHSRSPHRMASEAAINPNVRLFPRIGGINGSKRYTLGRRALLSRGVDSRLVDVEAQRRIFRDEWRRCFGPTTFDHIVDFSGYSPLWAFLLLQGQARSHSVWMHNDMATDRMKEVDGRRPLERGLGALFSIYRYFDRIVSVSPALAEVNRCSLGVTSGDAEYVAAVNTIDHERIRWMAGAEGVRESLAAADREIAERAVAAGPESAAATEPDSDGGWSEGDYRQAGAPLLFRRLITDPPAGTTTFVTVGRLSPEKNHARLIDAFHAVHAEHAGTRLIIIGDGALRGELDARIDRLGLTGAVVMAGQQSNPYAIMARADCFVLSSDYEGQPMVILEARTLCLPVVSTDFASVRGSLPHGVGLVVPRTADALAAGMLQALRGTVPNPPFDAAGYNRAAIDQFYRAIGAPVPVVEEAPAGAGLAAR